MVLIPLPAAILRPLGDPFAVIAALGPVAEWRFDDGTGQVVTDYAGAFDAQLGSTAGVDGGEPVWSATGLDMVERAQSENYVDVLGDLGMADGSDRTVIVVASVDLTDLGGTSFGYGLFNWAQAEATLGDNWKFAVDSNGALAILTTFGQKFVHPSPLTDDGWHFFAAVQDGPLHGDVTLHLDGETPFNDPVWGSDFSNLTGAVCYMGSPGVAFGSFKDGRHAYALVFDYALTDQQVQDVRAALANILVTRGITLP